MIQKNAVILNDTAHEFHHGCALVMRNIRAALAREGIRVTATCLSDRHWRLNKDFTRALKDADVAIINGEGTIHDDQKTGRWLLETAVFCKQNGIPSVLINTTYSNNSESLVEMTRSFDAIFVRETDSEKELNRFGIKSVPASDMTFYERLPVPARDRSRQIGVTDSVLMDLSEKLCALCRQQEGFRFLPMLYCDPFHWQGDGAKTRSHIRCFIRTQMTRFQERLLRRPQPYRHARMLYALPTYQAYHRAVSGLRGFVAARFHAFCMAMHSATPVLVIPSVTSKSESLLRDIGLNPDRIIGLDNLESAVARDFSYTADERERIDAYFAKVSTRFDEMFRTIRELAR